MKLNNLPSTLTSQKMTLLFLLTFLHVNKVKTGQAFKNCLANNANSTTYYNSLLDYFSTNSLKSGSGASEICCTSWCQYVSWWYCTGTAAFFCNDIFQSGTDKLTSCQEWVSDGPCGGVVGNATITNNNTLLYCAVYNITSTSVVADYLAKLPSSKFIGINMSYASYACPSGSPCDGMQCNWDNDGWTCTNFQQIIGDNCLLQWPAPWPGSANLNPYSISTSSSSLTSSVTTSPSSTSSPIPTASDNTVLIEETVIPTVGGITLIGGGGGGLIYRLRKKKKKREVEIELANLTSSQSENEKKQAEIQQITNNNYTITTQGGSAFLGGVTNDIQERGAVNYGSQPNQIEGIKELQPQIQVLPKNQHS